MEGLILSRPGGWVFDRAVADVFDRHVRKSIPCYDAIQDLIALLSTELVSDGGLVYDLGTATGEVVRRVYAANRLRSVRCIGIDVSEAMLEVAFKKCHALSGVSFVAGDAASVYLQPADLVVSAFTLQFLPVPHRGTVLEAVKASVGSTGSFILCEKIVYEDEPTNALITRVHERWKERYFTQPEIEAKRRSLDGVMHPLTAAENVAMMRRAGFSSFQTIFQWGSFAGILAR